MRYTIKRWLFVITLVTLTAKLAVPVGAQTATGSIRGTITDPQGAVVANATITATNKATGVARSANTGDDGTYLVSTLLPGEYEVKVTAGGFATQTLSLAVQVGSTVNGDFNLKVGNPSEVLDITADTTTIIDKQNFKIDGVITRQKIDALPLNGRNFLQLALLEPGVSVSVSNLGNANNLFNVSVGGGPAALTRITVDGGSVLDPVTGGAAQNFSTETIQEFQISTFNFDLSTGVTSVGAVNIVSRTGSNDVHGNAFLFFRDHSISALPTFFRPAGEFDPFFRRYQYGGSIGGPIKKDKAFFFGNVEKLRQRSAVSVFHTGPAVLSQFNTTFTSPYDGILTNVRGDVKINDKHNLLLRFSFDDNDAFAPVESNRLPSNWRANENRDYNIQSGLTTILRQNLVNDFRFNYQRINNTSGTPSEQDCPSGLLACLGARGAQIRINGSNLVIGNHDQAPQNRILDRYQTRDDVNWLKGSHRVRFGGEWEHNYGLGSWDFFDPAIIFVHSPTDIETTNALVNASLPAPLRPLFLIPIPASLRTGSTAPISLNDILGLSLLAGAAGVGDASQPPPFRTNIARQSNRFRFYGQDSWQIKPGFTLSYGASYQYETNLANHDLTRPELLRALVGNLGPAPKDKNNIAPSLGFAWDVKNNGKTVIRGGAGIYYDTVLFVTRLLERPLLGPAGDGRLAIPTAFFRNTISFPQVPLPPAAAAFNAINPPIGAGLNFVGNLGGGQTIPTKFTAGNLLSALAAQEPGLQATLAAGAAAGFSSIQFVKAASLPATLLDPALESPYSEQFTFGVQRELPRSMAVSLDFVLRKRLHITQGVGGALDLNLFNRSAARGGPVIPRCTAAQAVSPTAICSNGPIPIIQGIDRNQYKALLVKVDKRFTNRYQFTASYALSSLTGFFIGEDQTDWFRFHGALDGDARHRFTFSGIANLPWKLQASVIAIYASKTPFNARVPGNVDLNGDGTSGDTLPGLTINDLGRGTSKQELFQAVNSYNQSIAGPSRGLIRPLVLPGRFGFGDTFQSHDIRLSKDFKFKENYSVQVLVEVFNIFNVANLGGFSTTLDAGSFRDPLNPTLDSINAPTRFSFGQPSLRAGQSFGTGGPRALQLGARFTF